jgi:hypothetical protein
MGISPHRVALSCRQQNYSDRQPITEREIADFKGYYKMRPKIRSSFGGQRSIPLGQSSIIRQGEQAQLATFACAVIVPICESDRVKANFDAFLR